MSPDPHQPNSDNTHAELAFVQQALAAADRSERISRVIVAVLAILTVAAFFWMHHHFFPVDNFGELLNALLHLAAFFLVLQFAITMYLRQVINSNTRTILRAIANTRSR